MTDFVERKLVLSTNEPGDGWAGKRPRPKYWMAAYHYAWDYVEHFNKDANSWNEKYATDRIRASLLNINFNMGRDLKEDGCWGRYRFSNTFAWRGEIEIDIYEHYDDWEAIKHTIRHEITHAIDHQIMGNIWIDHCDAWKKIAKLHNVRTNYTDYGVHKPLKYTA